MQERATVESHLLHLVALINGQFKIGQNFPNKPRKTAFMNQKHQLNYLSASGHYSKFVNNLKEKRCLTLKEKRIKIIIFVFISYKFFRRIFEY